MSYISFPALVVVLPRCGTPRKVHIKLVVETHHMNANGFCIHAVACCKCMVHMELADRCDLNIDTCAPRMAASVHAGRCF